MATKKKTAKKKTAKKKMVKSTSPRVSSVEVLEPKRAYADLDAVRVGVAIETLRNVVDNYRDEITALADDDEFPQELISIASFAKIGQGALKNIVDMFEAHALRIKNGGGCFEAGEYRVDFEVQKGTKRVGWKALALANRKELTEAQGGEFDKSAYEQLISSSVKPTPDRLKPVIREVL